MNRLHNASVTDVITTGRLNVTSAESFGISIALLVVSIIMVSVIGNDYHTL